MIARPLSYVEFRALLPGGFSRTRAKAVALSGGLDSIALVALLREQLDSTKNFYTFTVDHGLRPESTTEAQSIHEDCLKQGLHHEILNISPLPSEGIEKHARIARYTALTRACLKYGITELYLGHHADDQVETLLLRLVQGSGWRGMAGMQPIARNPLSRTMFDAYKVNLHRPLLSVLKARLRATCLERNLKSYEDMSNYNVSLTSRNAIRFALEKPETLPKALQPESLLEFSHIMLRCAKDEKSKVKRLFQAARPTICKITGTITFEVAAILAEKSPRNVLISFLELVGKIVSPASTVDRKVFDIVLDNLYAHGVTDDRKQRQSSAAGLLWKFCNGICIVQRQPFMKGEAPCPVVLYRDTHLGSWITWDRRFWIRVHQSPRTSDFVVRALQKTDMAQLRALGTELSMKGSLQDFLGFAKGHVRFTLPVVVSGSTGQILALPSAGLSFCDGITVACRLVGEHIWKDMFTVQELDFEVES